MIAADLMNVAERQYAESLDAVGLPWVSQPRVFRFAGERYTPDFYLPIQNLYVEVIGSRQRWHQLRGKVAKFRVHFPDVRLVIVKGDGTPHLDRPRVTAERIARDSEAERTRREHERQWARLDSFARQIRPMRIQRRWSMRELAIRAGTYEPTISIVERGLRPLGHDLAGRIRAALEAA